MMAVFLNWQQTIARFVIYSILARKIIVTTQVGT